MKLLKLTSLSAFFLCLGLEGGTITQIGTRAGLGANDQVEWGVPADDGTVVSSPYARVSMGGLTATATAANDLAVFVQAGGGGYTANFNPGEILLDTFFNNGPITISFSSLIRGVGFNIVNSNTGTFTATMRVFGAGNVLFGTASVNGASNQDNDGSAPFLGAVSSLRDIQSIELSVTQVLGGQGITINQASLLTTDPPSGQVPEPTVALVSSAVAALAWMRARRPGA